MNSISYNQIRKEREHRMMKGGNSVSIQRRLDDCHDSRRHRLSSSGRMSLEDIELICSSLDTRSDQKRKRVEPKRILALASNGLKPSVETVSVKRGGAAYQVPIPIHERRQISLSVRWLLQSSMERMKKEKWHRFSDARMVESLFVLRDLSVLERKEQSPNDLSEIDLKSFSMAKKISMHRMAKSNRVFAHRRWR